MMAISSATSSRAAPHSSSSSSRPSGQQHQYNQHQQQQHHHHHHHHGADQAHGPHGSSQGSSSNHAITEANFDAAGGSSAGARLVRLRRHRENISRIARELGVDFASAPARTSTSSTARPSETRPPHNVSAPLGGGQATASAAAAAAPTMHPPPPPAGVPDAGATFESRHSALLQGVEEALGASMGSLSGNIGDRSQSFSDSKQLSSSSPRQGSTDPRPLLGASTFLAVPPHQLRDGGGGGRDHHSRQAYQGPLVGISGGGLGGAEEQKTPSESSPPLFVAGSSARPTSNETSSQSAAFSGVGGRVDGGQQQPPSQQQLSAPSEPVQQDAALVSSSMRTQGGSGASRPQSQPQSQPESQAHEDESGSSGTMHFDGIVQNWLQQYADFRSHLTQGDGQGPSTTKASGHSRTSDPPLDTPPPNSIESELKRIKRELGIEGWKIEQEPSKSPKSDPFRSEIFRPVKSSAAAGPSSSPGLLDDGDDDFLWDLNGQSFGAWAASSAAAGSKALEKPNCFSADLRSSLDSLRFSLDTSASISLSASGPAPTGAPDMTLAGPAATPASAGAASSSTIPASASALSSALASAAPASADPPTASPLLGGGGGGGGSSWLANYSWRNFGAALDAIKEMPWTGEELSWSPVPGASSSSTAHVPVATPGQTEGAAATTTAAAAAAATSELPPQVGGRLDATSQTEDLEPVVSAGIVAPASPAPQSPQKEEAAEEKGETESQKNADLEQEQEEEKQGDEQKDHHEKEEEAVQKTPQKAEEEDDQEDEKKSKAECPEGTQLPEEPVSTGPELDAQPSSSQAAAAAAATTAAQTTVAAAAAAPAATGVAPTSQLASEDSASAAPALNGPEQHQQKDKKEQQQQVPDDAHNSGDNPDPRQLFQEHQQWQQEQLLQMQRTFEEQLTFLRQQLERQQLLLQQQHEDLRQERRRRQLEKERRLMQEEEGEEVEEGPSSGHEKQQSTLHDHQQPEPQPEQPPLQEDQTDRLELSSDVEHPSPGPSQPSQPYTQRWLHRQRQQLRQQQQQQQERHQDRQPGQEQHSRQQHASDQQHHEVHLPPQKRTGWRPEWSAFDRYQPPASGRTPKASHSYRFDLSPTASHHSHYPPNYHPHAAAPPTPPGREWQRLQQSVAVGVGGPSQASASAANLVHSLSPPSFRASLQHQHASPNFGSVGQSQSSETAQLQRAYDVYRQQQLDLVLPCT